MTSETVKGEMKWILFCPTRAGNRWRESTRMQARTCAAAVGGPPPGLKNLPQIIEELNEPSCRKSHTERVFGLDTLLSCNERWRIP